MVNDISHFLLVYDPFQVYNQENYKQSNKFRILFSPCNNYLIVDKECRDMSLKG